MSDRMKNIDLTGKVALITGGTRGIGKAIVKELVASGCNIYLTGMAPRSVKDYDDIIKSFEPINEEQYIKFISADFNRKDSIQEFIDMIQSINKIDICINNAGTNQIMNIKDISIDDIKKIHQVNLYLPFIILSTVLEKMKNNNWGRVVNIGSLWSKLSRSGRSIYSASKYGLMGLTVTSALEYASHGVLVNMVSPGFVMTDLSNKTLDENEKKNIESNIPLGKFAQPNEIANVVLFLCSKLNSYITGQNIIVDGGYICE